ncbi:MAG: tRNA (adenosine(37)-N6)-threonylcarbamoyltransferase complex dimerization subunit type 1 TsaB [Sphingomicrobium sp.]
MILAIDTSTAACSVALFDGGGACIAHRDEVIGRGHAERLVPLIDELLGGRAATHILVGVGPGSFTGLRVGIAAAQGMAIGWDAELAGLSSLALLAAGAADGASVAAATHGGHGELFVQQFNRSPLCPSSQFLSLTPADAAAAISAPLVVGPAASDLVAARGWGDAVDAWPRAANALSLPEALRSLEPRPIYARAPDARAREAA